MPHETELADTKSPFCSEECRDDYLDELTDAEAEPCEGAALVA
jgi:hypothetical protein